MKYILICVASVLLLSCGDAGAGKFSNSAAPVNDASPPVPIPLSEIDLTRIGHIAPKGRVQDADYNQLPIVQQLLAHGKESIPFLISKLEDETKIEGHVLDFWSQVYAGDVALVILSDFFLDKNWQRSTIAGMHWNELLGRGNNKNISGEQVLRNYIERYGRRKIKERWQKVWQQYQDRIFWDEQERAFKVRA
ncbi:MAG TPA: hypothetical protein VFD48_00090 [Pyrinomonadaceae bacterium]|nr:hypothetical protein [Pyrinomonadaceae bacterium]